MKNASIRLDGAEADPCDPLSHAFDTAFDQGFGLLAFTMNRHLIDHMLRCVRELEVDFESLVIWGLLSHLNVAHLIPPGTMPKGVLNEVGRFAGPSNDFRPMRLRDLAQISRLPKETIRRKLVALEGKGFVERVDDGWISSRKHVEPRLREFNRESLRRVMALNEELRRLLLSAHGAAVARAAESAAVPAVP